MKKRLLSALLTFCMVLTMLPVSALAAPGDEETTGGEEMTVQRADSGLAPEDRYYTFSDGELDAPQDPDITLHKQATLNEDGTYKVTLSATAKETIQVVPTEVVFVIDGSASMYFCPKGLETHQHDEYCGAYGRHNRYNPQNCQYIKSGQHVHTFDENSLAFCSLVKAGEERSRWDYVMEALDTMVESLGSDITCKFVVYQQEQNRKGEWYNTTPTYDTLEELQNDAAPLGGTPLSAGVNKALTIFNNSVRAGNKVMIIVADGEADRNEYPTYQTDSFKRQEGCEIYTVGFAFSSDDFTDLATQDGKHEFSAENPEQLNVSLETIRENIVGLINDPLGSQVQLDGNVEVQEDDRPGATLNDDEDIISWTDPNGLNGTVTLTYDVALKETAKEAGVYEVPLNNNATLNYIYDGGFHSIPFPEPKATVRAATLDIVVVDGSNQSQIGDQQWVNLDTKGNFVLTDIPGVGEEYIEGKWVASVTVTAKDGDQDVDGVTLDDLSSPDPYAYTVTVTLTDEEPNPEPEYNGTAVTVQVFVDGEETPVTNPLDYVSLDRNTKDTTRDLWEETVDPNGTITCKFNYNADNGYDCVDIDVEVTDDGYVLQGITYFQSYGSGSPEDVDDETSGTYTIDNVTAVGNANDPDVKIYLRTPYSVKYLVDNGDSSVMDSNVYITGEDVKDSDVNDNQTPDADDKSAWMDWKNDDLLTEITVKGLPQVGDDKTIEGWWLNDSSYDGDPTYGPSKDNETVDVEAAVPNDETKVIKFYAKTDDAKVPGLTVEKELTSVTRGDAELSDFNAETYVAQVGDTLHYTITVTNTGNTEQSGTITDTFTVGGGSATLEKLTAEPAGSVDFDETPWTFSGLASKGTITITADYTVQPGDKSIRNSVDVDSNDPNTPEDPNKDDNTVETKVASLTVEKTADRETAFVGDTITYTVTVTNTGDVAINDITVKDDKMPETVTVKTGVSEATTETAENGAYTIGTLEAGSEVTITYTYTVTAADAEAGRVANVVTADSDQTKDPDPEDPDDPGSDSTETTILPSATEVTKYVVTSSAGIPGEILEELDGLDITYPAPAFGDGNPQIVASAGETITLLYEISVFGNEGASFTVTEESGANFIGAVGAEGEVIRTLSEPPQYAGQIGEGARYATLYFTKTFEIGENTTTLTNSITAVVNGEEEDVTEKVDVAKPGLYVDKTVQINGEPYKEGMVANENDKLTYTITVKNTGETAITDTVTVSDSMWVKGKVTQVNLTLTEDGETITLPANVSEDGTLTVNPVSSVDTVFEPGETWTCTYTYTVTAEDVIAGSVSNTVTAESGNGDESTDEVTVPAGSITITPADITIYTGGDGYSNVLDENGTPIATTAQGFPEPGYHLTLPDAVKEWLRTHNVATDDVATNLAGILSFRYYDENGNMIRNWDLEDQGVYSKEGDVITAYVYSLSPNTATAENGIKVRLQIIDPENSDKVITTDDIVMGENLVSDTYEMTIYSGTLDQSKIQAEFSVNGETLTCNVEIGTGELLVKSVTDIGTTTNAIEDNGDAVASGTLTAVADSTVHYYVNDSEVTVDPDRVQLLVDSVSNSTEFNRSMEQDAINKADAQDGVSLSDAQAESFYLDLVDTQNGNTVVTLGDDDKLTIYWPMPSDADENGEFYIVHYDEMDRTQVSSLQSDPEIIEVTRDGDHLVFQVGSFSPFVLVYEEDDGGSHSGGGGGGSSNDDDDDDKPELNKEDHIAYVSGYPDGTVQPEGYITREEVATIFFRLLTDSSRADFITEYNPYPDVEYGRWSYYAITTMTNGDLMLGRPGGVFDPGANITRAEFAVVASLFSNAQYSGPDQFTDISDHWARDYINRAAAEGWVAGYPDGTFGPDRFITRAEVMALVNEVLERAPDADYMLEDMTVWPDNPESAWYYEDVQEATNSHAYVWRNSQHTSEDWEDFIPMRTFDELVRDAFLAS